MPSARRALPPPFLWPVKGTSDVDVVQRAKAAAERAEAEERNRLLYVALTRARDRLYVAGFEGTQRAAAGLLVQSDQGRPAPTSSQEVARPRRARRLAARKRADGQARAATAKARALRRPPAPLPAWAKQPAPPEPLLTRAARALAAGAARDRRGRRADRAAAPAATPSRRSCRPTALADDSRFLRGTLTHALLEHLPTLPQAAWAAAAEAFVASARRALPRRRAQEHRRRDAGGAARSGVRAAVRPRQPRRGGDRRRGAAPAGRGPGAAARRQDRPPGAGRGLRS